MVPVGLHYLRDKVFKARQSHFGVFSKLTRNMSIMMQLLLYDAAMHSLICMATTIDAAACLYYRCITITLALCSRIATVISQTGTQVTLALHYIELQQSSPCAAVHVANLNQMCAFP
ncbi:hypothetical protein FRX31_011540 [Thalictrum thalictroides]|uniref:Uncharacterized protein n=1 Tax=Thalictrum thalictroides TaxID=46969 RepID=A0A7J6WNB0_THATH|nr:hypothetical protein FRX31_011540 [Thalictrum thalictroides]